MESGNILSGGVDTLNEIKEHLLELHGYQSNVDTLTLEEKDLGKNLQSLEKDISDEIEDTVKKRRQEIEDTFDKQMEKIRAKLRKTREKRDRQKNMKVSERIKAETAPLTEENNQLKLEAKDIFKQKHVPALCNTRFYYALYMPGSLTDFLIIILTIVIILFAIPCGIYYLLLPEQRTEYFILVYALTILVIGSLYIITGNTTKDKHMAEIKQVKGIRAKIKVNNKKVSVISKNIRKDRDESTYGLENFDEELAKLEKEEADFEKEKKEALAVFDNSTSKVVADEISARYEEKRKAISSEYEKTRAEAAGAEDKAKVLTIKIAREYEPYIGKDLMTLDRLDALINIIRAGSAENISGAVAFYRQEMNNTVQND